MSAFIDPDPMSAPTELQDRFPFPGATKVHLQLQALAERRQAVQRLRAAKVLGAVLCRLRARLERELARPVAKAPADRSEAVRRGNATRRTSFVGPPKPEAIATAQRLALGAQRQRVKVARFKAAFVGPPKPPKPARTTPSTQRRTRAATTTPRIARPPRARPAVVKTPRSSQPRPAPLVILGPPKPPRDHLRAVIRQAVDQAKAETAAHKAAAKALDKAGKVWDREAVQLLRRASRVIREQLREARQLAAKAMTPEQLEQSRAAVAATMATWTDEQRQAAQGRRKSFVLRAEAEQDRMASQAVAAPSAPSSAVADLLAALASPVRRTPTP